jgi:hypothetical protein
VKSVLKSALVSLLVILAYSTSLATLSFEAPLIATAMGDGSGSLILGLVCRQLNIPYRNDLMITAQQLKELLEGPDRPKTLIIATGILIEGEACMVCGGIETDVAEETQRVEELIGLAKSMALPIIGMHLDGTFSTPERTFHLAIDSIMPHSDLMLLVSPGEYAKYLRDLSEVSGIPLVEVKDTSAIAELLLDIFAEP